MICTELGRGRPIDRKHVRSLTQLLTIARDQARGSTWVDHRQNVLGTSDDAVAEAQRLLIAHPELVIVEEYLSKSSATGEPGR
jgi:hypothetical protein